MNERLKDTLLVGTLRNVVEDVADFLQKEVRLAKAELSEKLSIKLRAGLRMSTTGILGFAQGLSLLRPLFSQSRLTGLRYIGRV